jgi:hypothetical protein
LVSTTTVAGWESNLPDWLQQIKATEISFLATISSLLDLSLIEQNDKSDTYSMYAVVHDWIRASINTRNDNDYLQTAITTIGLAVPREKTGDSATIQRRLLPHVTQLLQRWDRTIKNQNIDHGVFSYSLNMVASLCADHDKLAEAEQLYKQVLQSNEKALGAEHMLTLNTVDGWCLLYLQQGKIAEAKQMCVWVLQGNEKALGAEHTSTLAIVST